MGDIPAVKIRLRLDIVRLGIYRMKYSTALLRHVSESKQMPTGFLVEKRKWKQRIRRTPLFRVLLPPKSNCNISTMQSELAVLQSTTLGCRSESFGIHRVVKTTRSGCSICSCRLLVLKYRLRVLWACSWSAALKSWHVRAALKCGLVSRRAPVPDETSYGEVHVRARGCDTSPRGEYQSVRIIIRKKLK